ncbi:hypothetical protein WA026_004705 [Henosepilachna vigintioctopunctata]|uniref:Chitin-binding type-2 domain-containing protein n=1 Tax=Henosepilachna vigintioctopunctata TaxID=420089 RepID=A0AAW1V166_9CUCU
MVVNSFALLVPASMILVLAAGIRINAGYDYNGYAPIAAAPIKLRSSEREQKQDFSKIPGVPGVDYPLYHEVPHTSFSCKNVPAHPGIYANVETGCQAYHVCHDGREGEQGASFLCTNGTIFNQAEFNCDWWYNVKCEEAPSLYRLNADPLTNPYAPKPKPEEELLHQPELVRYH